MMTLRLHHTLRSMIAAAALAAALVHPATAQTAAHLPTAATPLQVVPGDLEQPTAPAATGTQTLTLVQAWQMALEHDPTFQAAISEREAGQTERAIGRAGLLPQIGVSASRNKVRGTLDQPGPQGQTISQDLDYTSRVDEIRGTQTLFNWGRFAEYRQGHARADYSLAVFDTKENDTTYRLINRYFQTLLAFENVLLTESRLDANTTYVTAAERRFDGGEGTITEIREAMSRRDLARADLILAQDDLKLAVHELQEMVGRTPLRVFRVKDDFRPGTLQPETIEGWLALALSNNPEIRAGYEAVRMSHNEVHRTFGDHLPSLDAVVARRKASGETISTRSQKSLTTSYGLQASLSIFSGGRTHAQVTQARHNRDRSRFELDATHDQTIVEVTRQYQGVKSGSERIAALVQAVESSGQALVAVERGFDAGTRSMVDVLDAQDFLYQSRLDLMQARLEYIVARLMLAGAADTLDAQVLSETTAEYFGTRYVDIG